MADITQWKEPQRFPVVSRMDFHEVKATTGQTEGSHQDPLINKDSS